MLASSHATNYVFILCWHIHRNSLLLFHLHALSYDHALRQHFKTKMSMWIYEDFPNMCSYMQAPQIYSNPAHRLGARTSLCGSCNAASHCNTCSTFLQHMYPHFLLDRFSTYAPNLLLMCFLLPCLFHPRRLSNKKGSGFE